MLYRSPRVTPINDPVLINNAKNTHALREGGCCRRRYYILIMVLLVIFLLACGLTVGFLMSKYSNRFSINRFYNSVCSPVRLTTIASRHKGQGRLRPRICHRLLFIDASIFFTISSINSSISSALPAFTGSIWCDSVVLFHLWGPQTDGTMKNCPAGNCPETVFCFIPSLPFSYNV